MATNITFSININEYSKISEYSDVELAGITKFLFNKWYSDNFIEIATLDNLDTKIDKGLSGFVNEMNTVTKEMYGIVKSNKKGKVFENVIETIISETLPNYSYDNTSTIDHSGDGKLISPSGLQCIIELKNYTATVNITQIVKLKHDMKIMGCKYGLMLSANSAIQGKKNLDIETFIVEGTKYHIVFVSYYFEQEHKIETAIALLEQLYVIYSHNTHNIQYIEEEINNLNVIIDSMSKLKTQFLNMERITKDNLDSFYLSLRDTEYNMKSQISTILGNIGEKVESLNYNSEQVLKRTNKKECILLKHIYDTILLHENFELKYIDDDIYIIDITMNKKLGVAKFVNKRIDIIFDIPEIKLSITQNNLSMSETLVKSIIQNYRLLIDKERLTLNKTHCYNNSCKNDK